jgi:hypothetical protein
MSNREPVAQPVEHLTFNQGVMGSNPIGLTNIASLDRNFSHLRAKVANLSLRFAT